VQYYLYTEGNGKPNNQTPQPCHWSKNEQQYAKKRGIPGIIFFKNKPVAGNEVTIMDILQYHTEIESSFRTLKPDLDLRRFITSLMQGHGAPAPGFTGLLDSKYSKVQAKSAWINQSLAGIVK